MKYWVSGIALAALGLLLARVLPRFLVQPTYKLAAYLIGVALALAGLSILTIGIGIRAKRRAADDQSEH